MAKITTGLPNGLPCYPILLGLKIIFLCGTLVYYACVIGIVKSDNKYAIKRKVFTVISV